MLLGIEFLVGLGQVGGFFRRGKGLEDLEQIRVAVEESGALQYTAELARDYVKRAIACLEVLPASEYRDALVELSEFAVARTH